MKIVVVGGAERLGTRVVRALAEHGHDAVSGKGLSEELFGASVVVDVSDAPASTTNLLDAEADAGVSHHIALSVVGSEYFRAKLAQEELIASGPVPYTLVRATQFFESLRTIADSATVADTVRVAPIQIQPIASADVAEALATAAVSTPLNGITEIAGPEIFRLDAALRTALTAWGDHRQVVADPTARYLGIDIGMDMGIDIDERALLPAPGATLFDSRLTDWILETAVKGNR